MANLFYKIRSKDADLESIGLRQQLLSDPLNSEEVDECVFELTCGNDEVTDMAIDMFCDMVKSNRDVTIPPEVATQHAFLTVSEFLGGDNPPEGWHDTLRDHIIRKNERKNKEREPKSQDILEFD